MVKSDSKEIAYFAADLGYIFINLTYFNFT